VDKIRLKALMSSEAFVRVQEQMALTHTVRRH